MKNRFIFPCETPLVRVDAVDEGLNASFLSSINPTIRSHTSALSSERLNQAGYQ